LVEAEAKAVKNLKIKGRIIKIPNGVDLKKANSERKQSRGTLLYLGRLHQKKGIAETLLGWSLFQKRSAVGARRWELVIAGWDDGGYVNTLFEIVRRHAIKNVHFVGAVWGDSKEALYENADATILASHSEGLPMTVLESWAAGKPVFMTEQCNLPEGFKAGAAFRITTNPEDIATTLVQVLLDETQLFKAGQAGQSLVESSFNWTEICKAWLSLYRSLQ
jgi:poly(glycerol-phosphate) alpha-glucosyltransferase